MRRSLVLDIAVIIVATVITHTFVGRGTKVIGPDSRSYIVPAENLVAGRGLLGDGNVATFVDAISGFPNRPAPDAARSPIVPLMIAASLAAGRGIKGVIAFQYFLNLVTAVVLYEFTRRRLSSRPAALATALFFVCCPPVAANANQIGSETLFTLLILLTIILVRRACEDLSAATVAAAGLVLGLAVLTRPIALYFIVPLAAAVLAVTRRATLVIVFILISQILPAAWMWRNLRDNGVAIVSTIPADSLLSQWAAGIQATRNRPHLVRLTASQQSLGFRSALHRSRLPLFYQAMALARADGVDPAALNPAQKSVYERRLALHVIRANPVAMAELMFSAVVELQIFIPAAALGPYGAGGGLRVIACAVVIATLFIVGLGVHAIFRHDRALALLIAATIIYFTVAAAVPETVSRYALVYVPWYGFALVAGLHRLAEQRRSSAVS